MNWRPFYWDDLGNDWIYRVCVTVGLACSAAVVVLFVAAVVVGLVQALA